MGVRGKTLRELRLTTLLLRTARSSLQSEERTCLNRLLITARRISGVQFGPDVDVGPLGQVGHVLDHGVQVVEAGDGGEHPVHDAGPEQAVTQLRRADHINIGECGP